MKIKIHVTGKHIREGDKACATSCPIALALKEKTGKPWIVIYSYYKDTETNLKYKTTKKMIEFLSLYDNSLPVKPFSFSFTEKSSS